ncbi:DUF3224 domain-containing protein [Streptomyces avicenniae]|uniref:DUF3224 domain-containing protein n=1 Tax=Streptomyces avicenniae TaxID=500153 RepID=UPI000699E7CB|nr:DUF3224 domain-containing protein [Streptomyces avicenniae]
MEATGTFTVTAFDARELVPLEGGGAEPAPSTGLPVGLATLEKTFTGEVAGRSATLFTSAFDETAGAGTYLALESFEGALHDREGAFNFVHSLSMAGGERTTGFFTVVPGSGTGGLTGISGTGDLVVEADGTHRIRFDYQLD